MEICKVLTYFGRLSDAALETKAAIIIASLTGNVLFVFANNELTNVVSAHDDFNEAIQNAANGGKLAMEHKAKTRKVLINCLRILGFQVNALGYNNREKLLTTGFDLSKKSTTVEPKNVMPDIKTAKVTGIAGQVFVEAHNPPFTFAGMTIAYFIGEVAPPNVDDWQKVTVTTLSHLFEGLPAKKDMHLCISFLLTKKLKGVWSDVITLTTI